MLRLPRGLSVVSAVALVAGAVALATPAAAQIKQPGAHPHYAVDLEPHFLVQWDGRYASDEGFGLGLRATIPVVDNGPIPKINNTLGVGFGLDWAHFSDGCWGPWDGPGRPDWDGYDCSENDFWLPVAAQWNFFFTPVFGAFTELGLGMQYSRWSWDGPCAGGRCEYDEDDFDVEPLFAVGPRFVLADSFAIVARIGWPYFSVGASFFL